MEKLEFMEDLLLNFGDYDDTLDMHFRNIFVALHDTMDLLKLRNDDLLNLLKAFKQDAVKNRYDKFEDILEYSENSANPVGRLVLKVFDYDYEKDKNLYMFSDFICTALQLTNFWQDISIDLKMNRVYLPIEIMDKYGYCLEDLYLKVENDKFRKMMKDLVDRTEQMFFNGTELTDHLKGRLRMEIKATLKGGMRILNLIRESNYKVLSGRVKLSKLDKIKIITTSVI